MNRRFPKLTSFDVNDYVPDFISASIAMKLRRGARTVFIFFKSLNLCIAKFLNLRFKYFLIIIILLFLFIIF